MKIDPFPPEVRMRTNSDLDPDRSFRRADLHRVTIRCAGGNAHTLAANLDFQAAKRGCKVQFKVRGAGRRRAPAALTTLTKTTEKVAEINPFASEAPKPSPPLLVHPSPGGIESGAHRLGPKLIVQLALIHIPDDVVSGGRLLEACLRGLVSRVLVRVELPGECPEGFLDVGPRGGGRHPEGVVQCRMRCHRFVLRP